GGSGQAITYDVFPRAELRLPALPAAFSDTEHLAWHIGILDRVSRGTPTFLEFIAAYPLRIADAAGIADAGAIDITVEMVAEPPKGAATIALFSHGPRPVEPIVVEPSSWE